MAGLRREHPGRAVELWAEDEARLGLKPVAHIRGGFGAWKTAGGPVEMPEPKPKS